MTHFYNRRLWTDQYWNPKQLDWKKAHHMKQWKKKSLKKVRSS